VFDFEQADGRVFLVMELAAGGTLRNELQGDVIRRRPLAARLADAHAITAGLAAIHDCGIVHRDLSPQNVLRMSDGRLVLSDFGLATDCSENSTSVHGGTVAYMAPEVVRGGHASFASDVWALGVVMHEAVFGARPRWRDVGSFELLEPELGRRLEAPERGIALFYLSTLLFVLLAFCGLAVDLGRGYIVKAHLSKAVDGAALAAARYIGDGQSAARAEANKIFGANFPNGFLGVSSVQSPPNMDFSVGADGSSGGTSLTAASCCCPTGRCSQPSATAAGIRTT
jgi:serine/threonine protein kinase